MFLLLSISPKDVKSEGIVPLSVSEAELYIVIRKVVKEKNGVFFIRLDFC